LQTRKVSHERHQRGCLETRKQKPSMICFLISNELHLLKETSAPFLELQFPDPVRAREGDQTKFLGFKGSKSSTVFLETENRFSHIKFRGASTRLLRPAVLTHSASKRRLDPRVRLAIRNLDPFTKNRSCLVWGEETSTCAFRLAVSTLSQKERDAFTSRFETRKLEIIFTFKFFRPQWSTLAEKDSTPFLLWSPVSTPFVGTQMAVTSGPRNTSNDLYRPSSNSIELVCTLYGADKQKRGKGPPRAQNLEHPTFIQ
jgi:hypothetical protein